MLIRKNTKYKSRLKLSSWRKIAFGTWNTVGDPSVYALFDMEVDNVLEFIKAQSSLSGQKITMSHFFGAAVGRVLETPLKLMWSFVGVEFINEKILMYFFKQPQIRPVMIYLD